MPSTSDDQTKNSSEPSSEPQPTAAEQEILQIVRSVVVDGRYIHEFHNDPVEIAKKLKYEVSPEARKHLLEMKLSDFVKEDQTGAVTAGVAAVAVAIVIVVTREAYEDVIQDKSGTEKL